MQLCKQLGGFDPHQQELQMSFFSPAQMDDATSFERPALAFVNSIPLYISGAASLEYPTDGVF